MVPGYRGSARQPIVVAVEERLRALGLAARAVALSSTARPSPGYRNEIRALRSARDELRAAHPGPLALVGRSFGGRMCAFLAAEEPPDALTIIGHPIAPPGRPRPRDEAALSTVRCPTLVVQGERDELGPLAVLERIAAANPLIEIVVLPDAGHDLGGREVEAADHVVRWISRVFTRTWRALGDDRDRG